ncbi:MAG: hydroxymethylglutaryl-CoA lyase [Leptolyngbya sp. PLA2]|nr:hydroxymethylglutaryl-CoA lyase [Leptolyngbya sp. PL-A2]MCQ3940142.1 hydroxymethylglutaryl-CoA lyase [cyanobacterium CYA1]MDL1904121.1 hydroxymethylglutaryl-CoA lyase [Synechococcales cyanobacterium CNB]GIK20126.1 MAG: hydroxymethylglutaryl-CoA lyase [Planctomycetota bacterium]
MPGVSERVRITDVSPRDGLQNEPHAIPTDDKARLVELLTLTGVDEVEVTSFVSPKWVPQLGDAVQLFEAVADLKPPELVFSALVPNDRGAQAALRVNEHAGRRVIDKVAVFTATSETFTRKNVNATIAESVERFRPVVALSHGSGLRVRGYVSCIIRCPFEGDVPPARVAEVASILLDAGVDEIDLGDTIGAATPESLAPVLDAMRTVVGDFSLRDDGEAPLTLHLHDTTGRAAECVATALAAGVRSFDAAAGGLGGCPFASTDEARAPGNIATVLLIHAVERAGFVTGVDRERLAAASAFAERLVALAERGGV